MLINPNSDAGWCELYLNLNIPVYSYGFVSIYDTPKSHGRPSVYHQTEHVRVWQPKMFWFQKHQKLLGLCPATNGMFYCWRVDIYLRNSRDKEYYLSISITLLCVCVYQNYYRHVSSCKLTSFFSKWRSQWLFVTIFDLCVACCANSVFSSVTRAASLLVSSWWIWIVFG